MEQVELVFTVVNEVDAVVARLHCQAEQRPGPLRRTACIEEDPVHLLAFRCRFRDLAVVAVDCLDVAVRSYCEAERGLKEVTGRHRGPSAIGVVRRRALGMAATRFGIVSAT